MCLVVVSIKYIKVHLFNTYIHYLLLQITYIPRNCLLRRNVHYKHFL